MTLISTVGDPNANSYVSLAEANSYMSTRQNSAGWSALGVSPTGDPQRETLLITATARLDVEAYKGSLVSSAQRLMWPRYGVVDRNNLDVPTDAIPRFIKEAVYELALAMLASGSTDWLAPTGLEGFNEVSVGPISVSIRHEQLSAALPDTVSRLIAQYLAAAAGFKIVR